MNWTGRKEIADEPCRKLTQRCMAASVLHALAYRSTAKSQMSLQTRASWAEICRRRVPRAIVVRKNPIMFTRPMPATLGADGYQAFAQSSAKPSALALEHVRCFISDGIPWLTLTFLDQSQPPVIIAVSMIAELAEASVKDLLMLHLSPARNTIISDSLDVHLSVEGLVRDLTCPRV